MAPTMGWPKKSVTATANSSAAMPALMIALRHDGGVLRRRSRRCWLVIRTEPLPEGPRSASVSLRPVRPRASTMPAALPRCLVRRLRLVC
jgi:hypothetical protein